MRIQNKNAQHSVSNSTMAAHKSKYGYSPLATRVLPQSTVSFEGLDAIILDADGTMVKTGLYNNIAWHLFCLIHPPKDFLKLLRHFPSSGTTEEVIKRIYQDISPEEVAAYVREKEALFLRLARNLREVKGLSQFISSAQGVKKGIATCATTENISFYLAKTKLKDEFSPEHIIDSSKVKTGKPNPEVYLKAAKALDVLPENCVAFEDSREGIKAASRAGMKVIGVATGLSKDALIGYGASLAIKDYTEINLQRVKALLE